MSFNLRQWLGFTPSPPHFDQRQGQRATLRRRFAAMLYEILMLLGVLGVSFIVPQLIIGMVRNDALPGPVLLFHVWVVLGIYFIWLWRHGGQTLSMRTWRIKLVSIVTNDKPSLQQCLVRYVLCWPSLLFYGAGLAWALFDRDRQFLHDRLAGTRIIFFDPLATLDQPER